MPGSSRKAIFFIQMLYLIGLGIFVILYRGQLLRADPRSLSRGLVQSARSSFHAQVYSNIEPIGTRATASGTGRARSLAR
jgi:hypothetical protein